MTTTEIPDSGTTEDKPWHLSGNNAPVFDELTITELEVKGSIPTELQGRYFRNGANPQTGTSDHWFVGDGMIHGVEISNGCLLYTSPSPRDNKASRMPSSA